MWKAIVEAFKGETTTEMTGKIYNFEDIKQFAATSSPNRVMIDVREPAEFSVVQIPNSVNMPFKTYPDGLSLNPEEFKSAFGFEKPSKESELIFFCAGGFRAKNAEEKAKQNGYSNTSVYPGSMNDWIAKGGDKLKF